MTTGERDSKEPLPGFWLSIDPGDVHVGIASWSEDECLNVWVRTPDEALDAVAKAMDEDRIDAIVYEKFALDPKRMLSQSGSEFATPQMIGVLKWLCRTNDVECVGYFNHQHKRLYKMSWYKALTLKDKRKLPWWGKGQGSHGKDAWCIGMWHKHTKGYRDYEQV